jgi:energy-coupling factor transporter ATP-binding protein EcfA2
MSVAFRFPAIDWPAAHDRKRATNPFATRWVRPGAISYHFTDGDSVAAIVERLRSNAWRGAIVGRHGSGKSTLLASLIRQIESAGHRVRAVSLHDRRRALPAQLANAIRLRDGSTRNTTLLIVDGYEQLGWWARRQLHAAYRRNDCGLLVTVHRKSAAGWLPILYCTQASLETVQYLVNHEVPSHVGLIEPRDVAEAFETHQGSVRETLFALYDLFERRRQARHLSVRN